MWESYQCTLYNIYWANIALDRTIKIENLTGINNKSWHW